MDRQCWSEKPGDCIKFFTRVEEQAKQTNATLTRLVEYIEGNGKPGLKQDVHDLKRTAASLSRVMWIIVAAAGAAVADMFARRVLGL